MLIFAIICLSFFLCSVGYIFWQRKQYRATFAKLNKSFDDTIAGATGLIQYDESIQSALGDKLLRYINANKERLSNIQADRDKIKTLISDISHQTKTPISNILLYSGLLSEDEALGESTLQLSSDIQEQAEKLKFLTDALVKMSRLETGILAVEAKMQPLKQLVSAAVSGVYPKLTDKNIKLSVIIDENIKAKFDAKWTKEVIFNILENAVKYTDVGGQIRMTATAYDLFIRLDIADTGIGIDEAEYTDIFKRFYRSPRTREQDGIGVGLYLAREIITLQGGYIKVSSKVSSGSVFSVFIPQK